MPDGTFSQFFKKMQSGDSIRADQKKTPADSGGLVESGLLLGGSDLDDSDHAKDDGQGDDDPTDDAEE